MITNKCTEKYTTNLKHHITKFWQCESLTLLSHLYTEHGTITSSDFTANFDSMTAHWNPTTPITDILQQVYDGKYLAEEGNEIIKKIQVLPLFYNNLHASGLFSKTLKTWREKPDIYKIYPNFVPFMTQQEKDSLNNQPTFITAGFSNAIVDSI